MPLAVQPRFFTTVYVLSGAGFLCRSGRIAFASVERYAERVAHHGNVFLWCLCNCRAAAEVEIPEPCQLFLGRAKIMINGEWYEFAENLARRLGTEGSVTLGVDEIIAETRTTERSARGRSFWRAAQRGDTFIDAFLRSGVTIEFEPNEPGASVEFVTFRPTYPTQSSRVDVRF